MLTSFISALCNACSSISTLRCNCWFSWALFSSPILAFIWLFYFVKLSISTFCLSITRRSVSITVSSSWTDLIFLFLSLTVSPWEENYSPVTFAVYSLIVANSSALAFCRLAEIAEDCNLYCSKSVILFCSLAYCRSNVSFSNLRSRFFSSDLKSCSCSVTILASDSSRSFSSSSIRFYLPSSTVSRYPMASIG